MGSIRIANTTLSDNLRHMDDEYALNNLAAMLFLGVLMIVGIVGNCVVFLVCLIKIKPSTTRCFILALSIIDLITCSICIPNDIIDVRYRFRLHTSWMVPCKLTAIVSFTSFASGGILMCVATERFMKICLPLRPQIMKENAKFGVLLAVIGAAIASVPSFILYREQTVFVKVGDVEANVTLCRISNGFGTVFTRVSYAFQFAVFIAAITSLVVLYFLILKRVIRCANNNTWSKGNISFKVNKISVTKTEGIELYQTHSSASNDASRSLPSDRTKSESGNVDSTRRHCTRPITSRRTTMMFFVITFMFIISFLPHLLLKLLRIVHREKIENLTGLDGAFFQVFYRFNFINFIVNPFIYSYFNVRIRKGIKALISVERCQK